MKFKKLPTIPKVPTTDEEVGKRLYESVNHQEMPFRTIYGIYQIKREMGSSLVEAYMYCLKLLLRMYDTKVEEHETQVQGNEKGEHNDKSV